MGVSATSCFLPYQKYCSIRSYRILNYYSTRANFKHDSQKWKFLEFKNLSSTNFEIEPWNLVMFLASGVKIQIINLSKFLLKAFKVEILIFENRQLHILIIFLPLKIFKNLYFDFKDLLNQNSATFIILVLTPRHNYQVSRVYFKICSRR